MDKEKLIPRLRFSKYNDAWEQRKVRDVSDRYDNLRVPVSSSLRIAGTTPYYGANGIQDYVEGFTHEGEFVLVAEDGANDLKNYPVKRVKGRIWVNNHAHVLQGKNNICDNQFLAYCINQADIESLLVGGGRAKLNAETMMNIDLSLPGLAEQIKIGRFTTNLDNLITLHQREYDKLLIMKKAMLEKMFPKNGGRVPVVRFSEFNGAWEYSKLGTISDKITEKNSFMEFTETFTNSAERGIINQRDFFDYDIAKQDKINGYYIVRPDDFVYNPRISTWAPVGPIGRNKLGRCGVMSPLYTIFRPKEVDNSFLEQFFKSGHWYSFMRFNGDTGARSDRFSIKDGKFFEMPIPLPKPEEQRRIGKYLDGLDSLISLREKKLLKLKNIKDGCLEKMFV